MHQSPHRYPRTRLLRAAALLLAGAAVGVPVGLALSQAAPKQHVDVLLRLVTSEVPRPANIEARHDRWEPGAETGDHDHPGPVILAILEGELVEETPSGRTILRAGQVVWRQARQQHNVKNASGSPARALAIHFDPAQN